MRRNEREDTMKQRTSAAIAALLAFGIGACSSPEVVGGFQVYDPDDPVRILIEDPRHIAPDLRLQRRRPLAEVSKFR